MVGNKMCKMLLESKKFVRFIYSGLLKHIIAIQLFKDYVKSMFILIYSLTYVQEIYDFINENILHTERQ